MLELLSNNQKIHTDKGSIRLSFENPVFVDGFKGAFSYPFNINLKRNNSFLGYKHSKQLHRLEVEEIDAQVKFNQHLIASGKLKFSESNDKTAKVNLKVGSNNFFNTVQGHTLKEIPFETLSFLNNIQRELYFEDSIINTYQTRNKLGLSSFWEYPFEFASFPVYNSIMFNNTDFMGVWEHTNVWNLAPAYYDDTYDSYWSQNYRVCFPYVAAIIRKIFNFAGYKLIENPFANGELRGLVLIQMYHRMDYTTSYNSKYMNLKDHVADLDIIEFMDELRKIFKIEYFFDENNRSVRIKFLKDILKGEIVDISSLNDEYKRKRQFEVRLDGYIFQYSFDENEATDILLSYLPDATTGAQEFEIISNLTPPAMEENDLPIDYKVPQDYTGYTGSDVGSGFQCLIPKWEQSLYTEEINLSIPSAQYQWASYHMNYSKLSKINPKLAFWRGEQMAYTATSQGYAQGNASFLTLDEKTFGYVKNPNYNLSLKWQDTYGGVDYGLIQSFWKEFIYFDQKLKIPEQFQVSFNAYQLKELLENIHKIRRIDKNNYLIKKVDVALRENKIGAATIEAYRL